MLDLLESEDYRHADNELGKLTRNQVLDEYYRYKLRSGMKLKTKMAVWLDHIEKRDNGKYQESLENFKSLLLESLSRSIIMIFHLRKIVNRDQVIVLLNLPLIT